MRRLNLSGKNKIVTAILLVTLVMATAVGVTVAAYHFQTEKVANKFTVGNVTTELVEDFYQKPGTDSEFTKTPRVTNTGADECLVRLRVTFTPEKITGKVVVDENGVSKKYLEVTGWSDNWVLNPDDGFLYYNKALEPGESTDPVFTTVKVNYNEENPWVDFDIILYQEAVQAKVIDDNGEAIEDPDTIWKTYKDLIK